MRRRILSILASLALMAGGSSSIKAGAQFSDASVRVHFLSPEPGAAWAPVMRATLDVKASEVRDLMRW